MTCAYDGLQQGLTQTQRAWCTQPQLYVLYVDLYGSCCLAITSLLHASLPWQAAGYQGQFMDMQKRWALNQELITAFAHNKDAIIGVFELLTRNSV